MNWIAAIELLRNLTMLGQMLLNLVPAFAAAGGVWVAFQGLSAWKAKINYERKWSVLSDLLESLYEYRHSIELFRDPLSYQYEISENTREMIHQGSDDVDWHLRRDVLRYRLDRVKNANAALRGKYIRAEALLGENLEDRIRPLFGLEKALRRAASWQLETIKSRQTKSVSIPLGYSVEYLEEIICKSSDLEDKFENEFNQLFLSAADEYRKALKN